MILSFDKEIKIVEELFGKELDASESLALAMLLVGVLDRGMASERDRCIHIIQRLSVNAMDVVREIRKPLR